MSKPKVIIEREQELRSLCEQYPKSIPVPAAANYMGMDMDCLRTCIDQGKCRFGIGGRSEGNNKARTLGSRFNNIPTLAFWNFIMQNSE